MVMGNRRRRYVGHVDHPEKYHALFWMALLLGIAFAVIASLMAGCSKSNDKAEVVAVPLPVQQDVDVFVDWFTDEGQTIQFVGGKIYHVNIRNAVEGGALHINLETGRLTPTPEKIPDSSVAVLVWPDNVHWANDTVPRVALPEPRAVKCVYFREQYYCSWFDSERF